MVCMGHRKRSTEIGVEISKPAQAKGIGDEPTKHREGLVGSGLH
jgi:hypothetical protein